MDGHTFSGFLSIFEEKAEKGFIPDITVLSNKE
jgi:hypothetical protein